MFFNGMDPWAPADRRPHRRHTLTACAARRPTAAGRPASTWTGPNSGSVHRPRDADRLLRQGEQRCRRYGRLHDLRSHRQLPGHRWRVSGGRYAGLANDPTAGENDWVVELGAFDFGNATDGVIGATGTTGSADGVPWTGMWNGQLFGPTMRCGWGPSCSPRAVWPGGSGLRPRILLLITLTARHCRITLTAVVGAFGATKDE